MKSFPLKYIFLSFLILSQTYLAQNSYDLKQFFNEAEDFYSQPGNWKGEDWLKAAIIVSATYGLMNFDETIRAEVQEEQVLRGTIPIEFGRMWGEPIATGVIGGFLLLQGAITNNVKNRNTAFEIIQSQLYASSVTGILKIGLGRARPYMNRGAFDYTLFHIATRDLWSFPSGHTTMAFALSTTLSQSTDNEILKIAFFIPAVITAYARIYEDKHWASDVFFGAFIGYFTANFFSDLHKSKEQFPTLDNQTQLFHLKLAL